MSKIQEQIKALQLKQKKIEYVSYIADLIKNDTKCIDFKEVQSEIVAKLEPFLLDLMTEIETDTVLKKTKDSEVFTEEEIATLKAVAQKINSKPVQPTAPPQPQNSPYSQEPAPQKPAAPAALSNQDKMSFALANRHLADKRVEVMNDQNVKIYGKVVGLDAPFVVVKTETGPTINVPLEKVVPA